MIQRCLLEKMTPHQAALEIVTLEQFVPADRLLRKVDFNFIRERVAHLYGAHNGRPALGPAVLFEILFIG